MYKKVFKGNKEYYAIHIEDINNLVGDLTAIIGTTKKQAFSHGEFDNYVVLYNYRKPNIVVDASTYYGWYLVIYKVDGDNFISDIYEEDDFKDNFIDEYQLKEKCFSEELLDLIEDVLTDASSEICQDAYGKESPCDECCYEEGYCDYDENGKAFYHRTGTCAIRKLRQKLKEIEGE